MMLLFNQPERLERYLENHSSPQDPVLDELARHTYLKEAYPHMLSGPILGGFLTLFTTLLSPSRILEVGTYTGYSAICLARGLPPGGHLSTIEVNDELAHTARKFFRKAGVADRIELITGDALGILPTLQGPYNLVFLDAAKEEYPQYYPLLLDKIPSGGYILADNALWGGKVLADPHPDRATSAIHRFNQIVTEDPRVENLLLPLRDGLMIIRRR